MSLNYLTGEGDDAYEGVGLEVEDEDFGRTHDHEIVQRGVYAAVQDPESVAPVCPDPVDGYQLRAVEVALSGCVPVPRRIGLVKKWFFLD